MAFDLTRFNQFVAEGRIIRNHWEGKDERGRETACLIAALAPGMRPGDCPADLMPAWFAQMTPIFDDLGSVEKWPDMIQRYAAAANNWHVLNEAAWRRCLLRTLRASLGIAAPHDSSAPCARVISLIDQELSGDAPTQKEWRAVAAVAAAEDLAAVATAADLAAAEDLAAEDLAAVAADWDKITDACLSAIELEISNATARGN